MTITYGTYKDFVVELIAKRKSNYIYDLDLRREIMKYFGMDQRTTSKHMKNMALFNFIRNVSSGKLELISDPEEEQERLEKLSEERMKAEADVILNNTHVNIAPTVEAPEQDSENKEE